MPYQKQTSIDNRRSFKFSGVDSDGEGTWVATSFKIKNKVFSRPIILTGKQAVDYFLGLWSKTGWKEGDTW